MEYGVRVVLKPSVENENGEKTNLTLETHGHILRDKVYTIASCGKRDIFSAWRVLAFAQDGEWKSYDGFDISKVESNEDDLEYEPCQDCDEFYEEDYEEDYDN